MDKVRRRSKAVWIAFFAFAAVILAAAGGIRWFLAVQDFGFQPDFTPSMLPTDLSSQFPLPPSPSVNSGVSIEPTAADVSLCQPPCADKVQWLDLEPSPIPENQLPLSLDQTTSIQAPEATLPNRRTAPVVGGADKAAFISDGEIWVVNLDGTDLVQLTQDGVPKSNLQWSQDGSSVYFLAGSCIQSTDLASLETRPVLCLDGAEQLSAFQYSPGEDRLALILDRSLYVIRNDPQQRSRIETAEDLQVNAACPTLAPYKQAGRQVPVHSARWSQDGGRLAIIRPALDEGRLVDLVHLLDISGCESQVRRLDEFPGSRFTMSGYDATPVLQNIGWDGGNLFALVSYRRNEGFGDLWIYNQELYRADLVNPIEGACCYRDPFFSPDGTYLMFAFQDRRMGSAGEIRLYYVPLATVGTGLAYAPVPLPDGFFPDPHSRPQPVLRTAR